MSKKASKTKKPYAPRYEKKTDNPKMGRRKKPIDWDIAKRLCECHCTRQEIAAKLGVAVTTMKERCFNENGITFEQFYNDGVKTGNASIRAVQYSKALKGDNTMLLWLGKNRLGQTDRHEVEINAKPFIIENPQGGEAIKLGIEDRPQIEGDVIDVEAIEQAEAARYDSEQELAREGEDDEYTKDEHDGRGQ